MPPTRKYVVPSSEVHVHSGIFRAGDRIVDTWATETASNFTAPDKAKFAAVNGEALVGPRDIPDYTTAAEYAKRNFVKLGQEAYADQLRSTHRDGFTRLPADAYRNPRAAAVPPPKGTGLYLGGEPSDFLTDSRKHYTLPGPGGKGLSHAERLAINAATNVCKFELGHEPAPGGGFETTSRHAATHMLEAAAAGAKASTVAPRPKKVLPGEEELLMPANDRAKVTHVNFEKDANKAGWPAPWATTQGDLPRHSVAAYIEKGGPPCDPSAAAGELAHTSTMKVVTDAGAVVEVPRVKSGLDLGHNAPYYQTVSMAASGQTDAYNQKRRGFCPEARPLSLVKNHPAISAARAARGI